MSFLEELTKKRLTLRQTETVVTYIDGKKYLESVNSEGSNNVRIISQSHTPGFVVDTKPDLEPALVRPNLYVGSQDSTSPETLAKYQINNVLSIGIEAPYKIPSVNYHFCELLDIPETDLAPVTSHTTQLIRNWLEDDRKVLVHCNAGVSRSVAVVVAFLICADGLTLQQAIDKVRSVRTCARPNIGFIKHLQHLENSINL